MCRGRGRCVPRDDHGCMEICECDDGYSGDWCQYEERGGWGRVGRDEGRDGRTDGKTDGDRGTGGQIEGRMYRQTDRQTDRQTEAGRQGGREAGRGVVEGK